MNPITVSGIVVRGHRVASQPSDVYPYGTLEKQKPVFKTLGFDLEDFYNGTLNISISPHRFEMTSPEITLERVEWTDLHPPETFSFSRCTLIYKDVRYAGWVYYPHPETKIRHFDNPSVIEILTQYVPDIHYGDKVEIKLNRDEITVIAE
ncbi:MAG: hypothetical protein WBL25_12540 [Anaerolineales bacterium]